MHSERVVKLFGRHVDIFSLCGHFSFTVHFEAKNSYSVTAYFFVYLEYQQKKVVRSSLFPKFDAKNIDREVQPKWSSFTGKMEVAKPFLCSKLSSKSC